MASMRALLAFDKFKDALTATEACAAAAAALQSSHPDWRIDSCPLTDGGEGFAEILTRSADGKRLPFRVTGPRGDSVEAALGLALLANIPAAARTALALSSEIPADGTVAIVEMASASGLALLAPEMRDPWQTTSLGTGELIRAAAGAGAAAILLGVGGSATNDLGLGALAALGLRFHTNDGREIPSPIPAQWPAIARITGAIHPPPIPFVREITERKTNVRVTNCASPPPIRIACDVTNPLLGPRGCAAVYGPQKGLREADRSRLEHETARLALMLCAQCGQPDSLMDKPGAGAAGGIAFGLMTAARAKLLGGFDLVAAWLDLDARIAAADVVITGEGRFDQSSLDGKGPGAVASRAIAQGKPVHVFAGAVTALSNSQKFKAHVITPPGQPLADALRATGVNLAAAVAREF